MKWAVNPQLSKKCRQFVMIHWGPDGLRRVQERPVSWVRHEANPQLRALRRKQKNLPSIHVEGDANRIRLELSTERPSARRARHSGASTIRVGAECRNRGVPAAAAMMAAASESQRREGDHGSIH